jgi:DUF971 family protein
MTIPTEITLHQKSKTLELAFDDGARFQLPFEFLRVLCCRSANATCC